MQTTIFYQYIAKIWMAIDFKLQLKTISEYSEYCKELDIISVRAIAEILKNYKVRSLLTEVIKQQTQHLRDHLAF